MDVDIEDVQPALRGDIQRWRVMAGAGVVEEDIDWAEGGLDLVEQGVSRFGLGNVDFHRHGAMPGVLQSLDHFQAARVPTGGDGDLGTGLGQRMGECLAEPAVAAGDDGNLAAQIEL